MSVGHICVREVSTASPEETAQDAARRMRARRVGTLVVLDEQRMPIGILSDRDLSMRVVADALDATVELVRDVMTGPPTTIHENAPIEQALSLMRAGPYRRLPVVDDDGRLVGLISLDDVLDLLSEEFRDIGKLLQEESPAQLARCW